ncbi:unnamed protein product [Diamesa serratosioi]
MSMTKKQKVSHRVNWDPLSIPEELHGLIFQHLSGKDVKTASEITWLWYHRVGESKICMEKIRLKLNELGNSEMELINKSPRNYQNFSIKGPINNESLKFLATYSAYLKSVKFINTDTNEAEETFEPILLPFLESLSITYISNSILDIFLPSSNKLKVIAFEKVNLVTRDSLTNFLNACGSTLVELELKNKAFDTVFEEDDVIQNLKLQLKILRLCQTNRTDCGGTLIVNYHRPTRRRTHINRHLDTFLLSQAKSLQSISLDGFWYSGTFQKVFRDLPLITEVSICRCVDHERLKTNCIPNPNIVRINFLKFIRCKRQTVWSDHTYLEMRNILKDAPHLKHLQVHQIPTGIVEYATNYFHNLLELTYNVGPEKGKYPPVTIQDIYDTYNKLKAERPNLFSLHQKNHKI